MSSHLGLVAITGANGTIGYASVLHALRKGYKVRCIVRRAEAFLSLKNGPSIQPYLANLEHAVVPDNTVENAYDDALAGADFVVHIAGAWPLPHLHPDNQIYSPFILSTRRLVDAARRAGTVRRVVFTQAGAGLIDSEVGDTYGNKMEKVLDEHVQVNQAALTYFPPLKSPHQAYCAAKSQCMMTLEGLRTSADMPIQIIQVIPGTVIGPSEFVRTRAEALKVMDRQTRALLFDDMKPRYAFGFVHVEDCARVHIEALDEGKVTKDVVPPWFVAAASSEEGDDGDKLWTRAVDIVETEFVKEVEEKMFVLGKNKVPINMPYHVDSRFTEKTLLDGQKIRGFEECVREVTRWYLSLPP